MICQTILKGLKHYLPRAKSLRGVNKVFFAVECRMPKHIFPKIPPLN